jgi:hypothetical protein
VGSRRHLPDEPSDHGAGPAGDRPPVATGQSSATAKYARLNNVFATQTVPRHREQKPGFRVDAADARSNIRIQILVLVKRLEFC